MTNPTRRAYGAPLAREDRRLSANEVASKERPEAIRPPALILHGMDPERPQRGIAGK
jgi:hypothetical protein